MTDTSSFADLLGRYKDRARLSAADLAVLTKIPKTSIENWLQGTASRPREWVKVLQLAKALHLAPQEADEMLGAARHPTLAKLLASQPTGEALALIHLFCQPAAAVPDTAARRLLPEKKAPSILTKPYLTFYGRQQELTTLQHWLSASDVRMIVVTGISGIGKSSLVLEAAMRNDHLFPFGIVYINARQQHNLAVEAIAYALLVDIMGAHVNQNENPLLLLQYYVRNQPMLLLLDNANSLSPLEAHRFVEYIRDILPEDGRSKLLMTTQAYAYESAGWPYVRNLHLEEGLDEGAALAFVKGITNRTPQAEEEPFIQQVVQRMHGHPKLLEVAAGVAGRWGWSRSYADLENQQGRVAGVMTTLLQPVINSLPVAARDLLSATVIFPSATFVVDEMRALAPLLSNLADQLELLTDHNLLNYRAETHVFQLHQLIGDHIERFLPLAETQKQQGRTTLAAHYLRTLNEENDKAFPGAGNGIQGINHEHMLLTNVLGLLETFIRGQSAIDHPATESTIDLTLAVAKRLRALGQFAQGMNLLNRLTHSVMGRTIAADHPLLLFYTGEFAYHIRDLPTAARALHQFLLATAEAISWERAQAFQYLAILHAYPRTHRYLPIAATDLYQASLRLWHRLGKRLPLAYVLNDLAYEKFQTSNHPVAPKWIEASLRIGEREPKQTPDDFRVWGIILRTTAHYYRDTEQWESAIAYFKQSSQVLRQAESDLEWVETDYSFGRFLIDIERSKEGIAVLEAIIPRCQNTGSLHTLTHTWITLGKAYRQINQFAKADAAYRKSLQISASLADEAKITAQYITYYSIGRLTAEQGRYDAAIGYYQQSLDLRRTIGHLERAPEVYYALALALKEQEEYPAALAAVAAAIAGIKESNSLQGQSILERVLQLQSLLCQSID